MILIKKTKSIVILLSIFILIMPYVAQARTGTLGMLDQFEISLGKSVVPSLVKEYGGVYELPFSEKLRLDAIFQRLITVVTRQELDYSITVLNSPIVNAFALPGGFVFITRGMLRMVGNDDHMLANVLGHELAHVEKKHGLHAVLRQMGLGMLMEIGLILMDVANSEQAIIAGVLLLDAVQSGYSREAEYEADQLGQEYALLAQFDPGGAVHMLDLLLHTDDQDLPMYIFRSHPPSEDRLQRSLKRSADYWSHPQLVEGMPDLPKIFLPEGLPISPKSVEWKGADPLGRYVIFSQAAGGKWSLSGYDIQQERSFQWLKEYCAMSPAWSPDGQYLAVSVLSEANREIWLLNRLGVLVTKWHSEPGWDLSDPVWSPDGRMLAYQRSNSQSSEIWVGYFKGYGHFAISRGMSGKSPFWLSEGVYFYSHGDILLVRPPLIIPVIIENPVPSILQRKKRVTPEVTKENDVLILRRPNIFQP